MIVCGHGKRNDAIFKKYTKHILWSDKYIKPNKFGLFEGNPAQYKIVSMGCKKALELGCTHIIKTRGDGIIYNSSLVLNDITNKPNKLWLTQQTSFCFPPMMGDCFMYGPSKMICKIWDSTRPPSSPDGLINTAHAFLESHNTKQNLYNSLLYKFCEFRDIPELMIYDMRWNFKKHSKSFFNGSFVDNDKFLWGSVNNWINYQGSKIISFDRNIFYTKRLFYFKPLRRLEKCLKGTCNFFLKLCYKFINKYFQSQYRK